MDEPQGIQSPERAAAETPALDAYDGSWELKKRNPVAAGFIVLFGIGALYTTVSSILTYPLFLFSESFGLAEPDSVSYIERIAHLMRDLANPIQAILLFAEFTLFLVPVVYFTARLHTSRVKEYLRFRKAPVVEILLAVLIIVSLIPITTFIAARIVDWLDFPEWLANIGTELFTAHSVPEFLWLVLVICITPAICEETLFRGYAQRTLERGMGAKSIWVVGILFGLYHMNPIGLLSLSIIGIVLGFFYYRSKSLLPSMAAHFTNNFIAIYILYAHVTIGGTDLGASGEFPLPWVLLSVPVSAGMLYLYYLLTRGRVDPFPQAA